MCELRLERWAAGRGSPRAAYLLTLEVANRGLQSGKPPLVRRHVRFEVRRISVREGEPQAPLQPQYFAPVSQRRDRRSTTTGLARPREAVFP